MTVAPRDAKRHVFAAEWIVDFNATQAALRAGYSAKSAAQQGSALLKDPKVQAEIARLKRLEQERNDVSPERVIAELAALAFANMADFVTWSEADGVTLTDSADLDPGKLAAVAEVVERTTATGAKTVKLKLHSKSDALDKLGRVLGLFVDRLHITGSVDRPLRSFTVDELVRMIEVADGQAATGEDLPAIEGVATVVEDDARAREGETND